MKNSLYLHSAVLFNSNGKTSDAVGERGIFDQNLSAKMLSLGMVNLFGQLTYPFTPLFSGDFSAMVNPLDGSSFIGPAITYSLGNNWESMVNGQLFFGREETEYGDYGKSNLWAIKMVVLNFEQQSIPNTHNTFPQSPYFTTFAFPFHQNK